jgi:hypothetical protein
MNPEQKKEYVAPTMNVVQVHCQNRLMQVSEEDTQGLDAPECTEGCQLD